MTLIKQKEKSKATALDDKALVAEILATQDKKRQRRLQEELYNRYASKVYYKCKSMVKVEATAKDLAHDILIKMFMQLNRFRGEASFYSWVIAITYNHCINFLEKKKRLAFDSFEDHDYNVAVDESDLEDKVLKEAQFAQLEEAMQYLKPEDRLILLMRYQDGLSVKAIAGATNMGVSAIKMRLKRSRDQMAQLINESDHE